MGEPSHAHPSTSPSPAPKALTADPGFRRFWFSREISIAGSLISAVALPVLIYRTSHSASLTALTTVLEGLPYLLFGLFAGAITDRVDRRKLMIGADLLNALIIGSIPIAWALDALSTVHVLIAAFLGQAVFVFFDGAAFGALPTLVGRDRIGRANSLIWGVGAFMDLSVPMLVGLVLAILHPAELLAFDALSFVASALSIARIRAPLTGLRERSAMRAKALLGEVGEGVRFLWGNAGVRTQTLVGGLQSLGGAGFMALSVPYADRLLGVGTSGWRFGAVYAAWGVGGIGASAFSAWALARWPSARLTLLALPFSALSGLLVVTTSTWLVSVIGMALWGVSYQSVIIASMTYRQEATPENLLGRVNLAGRILSFGIGWTAGALLAGSFAALIGLRQAMVILAGALVVGTIFAWLSPLRHLAAGPREVAPAN